MHIIHEAVIYSAQQPAKAAPKTTTLTERSSSELSLSDQRVI